MPGLTAVQWAPIPDRSVLGSMNDLIFQAGYGINNRDYSPVELSRWLAATPLTTLGGKSPDRVFPKLVG